MFLKFLSYQGCKLSLEQLLKIFGFNADRSVQYHSLNMKMFLGLNRTAAEDVRLPLGCIMENAFVPFDCFLILI